MVKIKRKVSLIISIGVLLTTVSPIQVLANEKSVTVSKNISSNAIDNFEIDVKKYIPKIKSTLQIGDDYGEFETYRHGREKVISVSWNKDDGHISVDIDEKGNITGYWKGKYNTNENERVYKFPKITREEGEKISKDFIKKIYPSIDDKIEINKNNYIYATYDGLGEYSYSFQRTENNVYFDNSYIMVQLDAQTGEVTSFNSNFKEDIKFPSLNGVISKDEAKKILKDSVGIELMYKLREIDKDLIPYLGYTLTDTHKTVDAKTKDIVNGPHYYNYPIYGHSLYGMGTERVPSSQEDQLINSKKLVSKKNASKKIIDTFKLGEGYEIEDVRLTQIKEKDIYMWELMVMKHEGNSGSGSSSTIDAKTGEIISFSDPGSWDEYGEEKYNKEELIKTVKSFLQQMNPEKYKQVEYVENANSMYLFDDQTKIHNFIFIRKSNDIKVENSGFSVSVSSITGNIVSYDYNWDESELPLVENIIEKEKAKEILLDDKDLELQYQTQPGNEDDIKLVYDFKDKHLIIDAKTEEIIDVEKESIDKYSKNNYKDIETSFAKNQINKLQDHISLFEGENFRPKEEITQKDFLSLLLKTKDSFYFEDNEDYLYDILNDENILKKSERNPQIKVTREQAVKYIVRAFGQESSANLGDIYKINYKDTEKISEDLKGHVAIASGLGIINGEGNFRPKDNLTREEAAVLIYNILNRSK